MATLWCMRIGSYIHHSSTIHDHTFTVPLDHNAPDAHDHGTVDIYAREIIPPGGDSLPYLVFMQGGPGGEGPRPGDFRDGFIGRMLKDYRVVLLDQRGTGRSHRLDKLTLSSLGNQSVTDEGDHAPTAQEIADYLMLFRQDQIVRDAEVVRRELAGDEPWTTLGQSFGGFINTCYLSIAPEGLRAVFNTGGLPGLTDIDSIYRLTYERTAARNRAYYERYPDDEPMIRRIAAHVRDHEECLPTGERLSTERFRMIGICLGGQLRFDTLHYMLEAPFVTVNGVSRLSRHFLQQVADEVAQTTPMYAVLQETIYAATTPALAGTATRWSADRLSREIAGFDPDADPLDTSEPYYLTGEHMMRSIFDEDPELTGLGEAADILANRTDWPAVYDPEVLAENSVPVASAVYFDDMFVPRELSLDTASAIRGSRVWVTNEYQHDGLRVSGGAVLDHLFALQRD